MKRANHSIVAVLRKVTALAVAGVFLSNTLLSGLSFAESFPGQKSTLRPWTVMEQPGRKREITAHMYRESRLIWVANSQRYLDLLARYNALALLLPSGRYLVAPETAANDLSLIRGCTHEDAEILMQQEERLHSTRYERLKKQLLNNEEIMALYRKLSGYKDITAEPDNIIFNDLIAKAFELLFIIDEYLVYPNTELTKEEREFIKLMRPILEAKDSRGRYKNFSQVFFDVDRRTKAIQALQEDKDEKFYRVASTELLDATPHRLTIAGCRERLIDNLKVIESLYPALQKEFAYGLEVFNSEGIDAFERKAYPRILKATDAVKSKVDAVSSLPAIFGFVEPELQSKLDAYLRQIAEELSVDKVLIWFGHGWTHDFTYTLGFTEEELIKFHLNRQEIFEVISDPEDSKKDKDRQLKGLALMKESGMASGLEVSPDYEVYSRGEDNYIRIVIGRSQKSVESHGELTEEDRKTLTGQINALIVDKTAPWLGIRDSLDANQYRDFSDFMMVLRHNGGIDVFKVGYFPFIYWHIPQYIRKIRANDSESQKWQNGFIGNLQYFVDESRTIDSMETFLQILGSGTDFKPRNITQYVHDRVESFRGMAISKGLDFSTEIANENMVVGRCDLNMLGIVVDNLIQNAIKYTREGKVQVRLAKKMMKPQTGPSGERECAVLEVEDTGIGIPADDKTKIFTRGYRASNVGDIQGTGIGLDAVSTIVHLMHGDIDVESEVGKGTKISVSIPLSHDKEPPDNKAPPETPSPTTSPAAGAVKEAFDTLNSEARKVSQLNSEISKLRGTSQNIMEVTKFRFCVPVSVLKNSPDITHALNTTGLLRQRGKDSDKVEFELVVTGVSDEDVSLIEGLNRDDIRKALNLPERFTVSMITERQMQDSARRFNYDVANPKYRVAIVKDFFSGTLADGEYMAIATDALGVENDADKLQADIEKEFKQELSQENISVRILVGPEHGKSMFSLSKIINDWLEALNQGNLSSIAKILPVPAPLTPELERAIRTAWAVLTAA